jgi:hypothetical protein
MKEEIERLLKEQDKLPFYLRFAKLSESGQKRMSRRKFITSKTYQTKLYFVRENYKPIL